MFTNIRGAQLLIILVVVLLFFGAKRLPELARSLGLSAKEFKAGLEDGAGDAEETLAETSDQAEDVATDIKENLSDT